MHRTNISGTSGFQTGTGTNIAVWRNFVDSLMKQEEVRIFVDVQANGTGHKQAALDLAQRLKDMGYSGQINFVLGVDMLRATRERVSVLQSTYDVTALSFNREWPIKRAEFMQLLNQREDLKDSSVISQDTLESQAIGGRGYLIQQMMHGASFHSLATEIDDDANPVIPALANTTLANGSDDIRAILTDNLRDEAAVDELMRQGQEAVDAYLREHIIAIPDVPGFRPQVPLSFSGAADEESGNLAYKTAARCCLALQPTGWDKGRAGIWFPDEARIHEFPPEIHSLPLCNFNPTTIEATEAACLDSSEIPKGYQVLKQQLQEQKGTVVLLYNFSMMRRGDVTPREIFEKIQASLGSAPGPIIFLDVNVNRPGITPTSELVTTVKKVKLSDLSEGDRIDNNTMVDCEYLPPALFHALLQRSDLVVCEGQGTAQKALLAGTPCLHSPMNAHVDVYGGSAGLFVRNPQQLAACQRLTRMTKSFTGVQQSGGAAAVADYRGAAAAGDNGSGAAAVTESTKDQEELPSLQALITSPDVTALCAAYPTILTPSSDRLARAAVVAMQHEKAGPILRTVSATESDDCAAATASGDDCKGAAAAGGDPDEAKTSTGLRKG